MSDRSQGQGWWLASDGKWYPAEKPSAATLPPPPNAPPLLSGGPDEGRRRPRTGLISGIAVVFGLFAVVFGIAWYQQASLFSGGAEQVSATLLEDPEQLHCGRKKTRAGKCPFEAPVSYTTLEGETVEHLGVRVPKSSSRGSTIMIWYAVDDPSQAAPDNPAGDEPVALAAVVGGLAMIAFAVAWPVRAAVKRRRRARNE